MARAATATQFTMAPAIARPAGTRERSPRNAMSNPVPPSRKKAAAKEIVNEPTRRARAKVRRDSGRDKTSSALPSSRVDER